MHADPARCAALSPDRIENPVNTPINEPDAKTAGSLQPEEVLHRLDGRLGGLCTDKTGMLQSHLLRAEKSA